MGWNRVFYSFKPSVGFNMKASCSWMIFWLRRSDDRMTFLTIDDQHSLLPAFLGWEGLNTKLPVIPKWNTNIGVALSC